MTSKMPGDAVDPASAARERLGHVAEFCARALGKAAHNFLEILPLPRRRGEQGGKRLEPRPGGFVEESPGLVVERDGPGCDIELRAVGEILQRLRARFQARHGKEEALARLVRERAAEPPLQDGRHQVHEPSVRCGADVMAVDAREL